MTDNINTATAVGFTLDTGKLEAMGGILGAEKKKEYAGDVILETLPMGTDRGFSKVASYWLQHGCMSYDDGVAEMHKLQRVIEDIEGPLTDWEGTVTDNGKYAWRHKPTSRVFRPTSWALTQIAMASDAASWACMELVGERGGDYPRDKRDAEALKTYLDCHIFAPDRVDMVKPRKYRTWTDGTLRAVVSKDYTVINNEWMLKTVAEIIPGGVFSHWKCTPDEIYTNVLIPDTIRADSDSDYGGMLSIGNSEIGTGRVRSQPSVFRAICMNGCIWDQIEGEVLDMVHRRKKFDLAEFRVRMQQNLTKQIPLLGQGVDKLLSLRTMKMGEGVNPIQVLGQASLDSGLTRAQGQLLLAGYEQEVLLNADLSRTAFGVTNAITRAAQMTGENAQWYNMDLAGGQMLSLTPDTWGQLVKRAGGLRDKDLVKAGVLTAAV